MNIAHFETSSGDKHSLEQRRPGTEHSVEYLEDELTRDTAEKARQADIVTVFVNSVVDASVIDTLPNLKLLITRSTGFDHIDIAHAKSKGIVVCNVPAYGSRAVAEFTFALLLGLSRKAFLAAEQIKLNNNWNIDQFQGFNLQGKTIGVIGTGRIGLNVVQIAKGFDMTVIAHDAFPNEEIAKKLGFTYVTLPELLAQSNVVTCHVPASKDTHHLINTDNIQQVKKGALLINTSRGEVIDPEAILMGLKNGQLAGAALDVLAGEHELREEAELMTGDHLSQQQLKVLLDDHILIDQPQVIITPHIAFNTTEARQEIAQTTMENIEGFLSGQPQNVITVANV
jgi:D-lactate dehydrogenase